MRLVRGEDSTGAAEVVATKARVVRKVLMSMVMVVLGISQGVGVGK